MDNPKKQDIEVLYQMYREDVYRYVLLLCTCPADAEDIVQNTFIRAMNGLGGFRGGSQIKTWLLAIARREVYRFAAKHPPVAGLDQLPEAETAVCIEETVVNRQEGRKVLAYIEACPEPKRSLLAFRLVNGLPFTEVGQILGKTDTWCRVTFLRAHNAIIKNSDK